MCNPFTRPDAAAELCHLRQRCATLDGELTQARATIAALKADNDTLRQERDEARENYEFYFDEYRRTCNAGGKHQ